MSTTPSLLEQYYLKIPLGAPVGAYQIGPGDEAEDSSSRVHHRTSGVPRTCAPSNQYGFLALAECCQAMNGTCPCSAKKEQSILRPRCDCSRLKNKRFGNGDICNVTAGGESHMYDVGASRSGMDRKRAISRRLDTVSCSIEVSTANGRNGERSAERPAVGE
ncbi:MAG: hypothetical protein RLO52_24185 [Sandaracinaceae bacterium]